MKLQRLRSEGRRLVTPEYVAGTPRRLEPAQLEELLEPFDRDVSLGELDRVVDRLLRETAAFDPALDALAAPRLHQALELTRREASDPAIWRFLTVVHRPDFIRHRWENRSWSTMRSRFWDHGTRPDSNTLCRLWWIAELSRDGNDYTWTERVLRRQTLANGVFVRSLSFYPPAVRACVAVLEDLPADVIEAALLGFNHRLGLAPLEGLEQDMLVDLLRKALPAPVRT